MQHLERCTIWNKPKDPANWLNSLRDAFISAAPGSLLVYRIEKPSTGSANSSAPENKIAVEVAAKLRGALVQWPEGPSHGDKNKVRKWLYAIQKPGKAVRS